MNQCEISQFLTVHILCICDRKILTLFSVLKKFGTKAAQHVIHLAIIRFYQSSFSFDFGHAFSYFSLLYLF